MISLSKCQELIDKFAGTGQKLSDNKECVNFGIIIGYYIDNENIKKVPTTNGIIHTSKTGSHIVPSKPDRK